MSQFCTNLVLLRAMRHPHKTVTDLPFSPVVIPPNIGCQIVVRCLPKLRKNNPVYTDIFFFVKLICSYCVWSGTPLELQYKHCFYLLPVITDLNTNLCIRIPLESQVSCWTASLDAAWREGDCWCEVSYWPRYRSPCSDQAKSWIVDRFCFIPGKRCFPSPKRPRCLCVWFKKFTLKQTTKAQKGE
jgi:hypothetical protein